MGKQFQQSDTKKSYYFNEVEKCNMCGDQTAGHKILGQRLNQSQGFNPKSKIGISVTVVQCGNCGLIYSNPQPIPVDFQAHYGVSPETYWKPHYFELDENYFSSEIKTAKSLIDFKEGMIALDRAGFDAYGLEPSEAFYERAVSKMNIPSEKIKLGMIENLDYEENSFDFITFGAVFEHLYGPSQCLEKTLKWLKPGGILHIEAPSADFLISKIFNNYFKLRGTNYVAHLSPMHEPFHMYEFRLKSFEELSKRLNFKIALSEYFVCDIMFIPKVFHKVLRWYMDKTQKGMQFVVWLRKK